MKQHQQRYNIYPSLLDAFSWYKKSDSENAFQELIDKINRVPYDTPEAARKGSAFEACVMSMYDHNAENHADPYNYIYDGFKFKKEIVHEIARMMEGSRYQVFTKADILTPLGTVTAYGYVDALRRELVRDLKTTSSYELGKKLDNAQHLTYMTTLRKEGVKVERHQYLVTTFTSICEEDYIWTPNTEELLVDKFCEFIEFLETHRDLITDRKIFGLEEAVERV